MEKLRFYDFMRAGHVKRWHIVSTTAQQSIAEHQYLVTIIAMELADKMGLYLKGANQDTADWWLQLMVAAMFHDAPEVRYGDFPSPAKAHIKEAAGKPNLFAMLDGALMPEQPYVGGGVRQEQLNIIKMADAIESAHWIREHKAGAHAEAVANGNSRRMAEMVAELTEVTSVDWFKPVNDVLMELGMPYISKAMMVTPP